MSANTKHFEYHLQRGRRNLAKIGFHGGELTAALRQIFLQHIGGSLDLIRIVLRFHGQTDFPFLEAVEDFRDRNGLGAIVFDGTDNAAFDNHKNADFKPYAAKSTDNGRTWTSIVGDLPARGSVWVKKRAWSNV